MIVKSPIKKTLLVTVFVLITGHCFSQHGFTQPTAIDVKGIFIGGEYTKEEVLAKWGKPAKYSAQMTEFGLDEQYIYGKDDVRQVFRFGDDGVFNTFHIKTADFPVCTAFEGGIKVGDDISRIEAIGLGSPVLREDGKYIFYKEYCDDPIVLEHSDGIITQISFVDSI